jgi:hypothetical protein
MQILDGIILFKTCFTGKQAPAHKGLYFRHSPWPRSDSDLSSYVIVSSGLTIFINKFEPTNSWYCIVDLFDQAHLT